MSQKAENLLNLALDATSEEREKSLELEVGYQPSDQEWDLIIKYSGNLEAVREIASSVTELSNEYAILTVPESRYLQCFADRAYTFHGRIEQLGMHIDHSTFFHRTGQLIRIVREFYAVQGQG